MTTKPLTTRKHAIQIADRMRQSFDGRYNPSSNAYQHTSLKSSQTNVEQELLKYLKAQKFAVEHKKEEKNLPHINLLTTNNPENVTFNDSLSIQTTKFNLHEINPFANRLVSLFDGKAPTLNKSIKRGKTIKEEKELPPKSISKIVENKPKTIVKQFTEKEVLGFFTKRATEEAKSKAEINNWYATDSRKISDEFHQRNYSPKKTIHKNRLGDIDPRSVGIHGKHVQRSGNHHESLRGNAKDNALFSQLVQMSRNISPNKGHTRN